MERVENGVPEVEGEAKGGAKGGGAAAGAGRIRCRALTVRGLQCRQPALREKELCYHHDRYGEVRFPADAEIAVPFLDDPAAIQLVLTQVAEGMLRGRVDPQVGRATAYACQVAMSTLARPAAQRLKPMEEKAAIEEPVAEVVTGADGQPLAPVRRYVGPEGEFKPTWSISKFFYEKECERLGQQIPSCAEEYPEEGWLTEEEMKEDPEDFKARTHRRLRKLRLRAGEATVRDLEEELNEAREEQARERERDPFGVRKAMELKGSAEEVEGAGGSHPVASNCAGRRGWGSRDLRAGRGASNDVVGMRRRAYGASDCVSGDGVSGRELCGSGAGAGSERSADGG